MPDGTALDGTALDSTAQDSGVVLVAVRGPADPEAAAARTGVPGSAQPRHLSTPAHAALTDCPARAHG